MKGSFSSRWGLLALVACFAGRLPAEEGKTPRGMQPFGPRVVSPEVSGDRHVTFRLFAPRAESVGPLEPGAYRYRFTVDRVQVLDPQNPATSESQANAWSLVYVHGAVAEVTYHSKSLGRFRRMHVYTPPGCGLESRKYPVLYLLHGAFDCDDSWSTVGRAGFILDNLIAAGKAQPMIVVMPAGHTGGPGAFGPPRAGSTRDEFIQDFTEDIVPYAEAKKGLALVWFATGSEDFLVETSRATVAMLKKHGFDVTYQESAGGHTWKNWREYLRDFAPLLFREEARR